MTLELPPHAFLFPISFIERLHLSLEKLTSVTLDFSLSLSAGLIPGLLQVRYTDCKSLSDGFHQPLEA